MHTPSRSPQFGRCFLATLSAVALILPSAISAHGQSQPEESNPWGVSSSASSFSNHAEWLPRMAEAGVRWVRLFPEWGEFQSAQDTWKWDATDAMLKSAAEHGIRINAILMGHTPGSKEGSHTFPMNNLAGWSNYVSTVVGRYKDQVRHWEVWNEGNAAFNDGKHTTEDYATLAATTYIAAKKSDPKAQVGLTVASFDAPYLREAIRAMAKAGKADHFDYLCIHPYEVTDGVRDHHGEIPFLWMARTLRDFLKKEAPARANADLWITEIGQRLDQRPGSVLTQETAAKVLAKVYTMAIAQGIAHTQWFEARDPVREESGFGLLQRDGAPRATYATLKTLSSALGATPKYEGWLALGKEGRGYGFVFQGASGPLLVAWMPRGETDESTSFPASVTTTNAITAQVSDVKAGEPLRLNDTPILVSGIPASIVEKARANTSAKFPWGGDHSAAKIVSNQLGNPKGNDGLFLLGSDSLPAHTFPDGSTGVQAKSDQLVRFFAHPSFANLDTREYYVRITVRRLGAGNVGMNLHYEIADTQGRTPYKNRGQWFGVSSDPGWQTYTWHIKDACFSKMWGYDIAIRPEQSVPFVIGKVEVSTAPF
jgi:hypothetical protein